MKSTIFALLLLAAPALVSAQNPEVPRPYNGNAYGYFTTGACQHGYALYGGGGGGEAFLWKGISLGGEAGYQQFSDGWGFGLLNLQPGYHFNRKRNAKWDPFVTYGLGFALGSRGGYGGTANLGGGATYWFKDKLGLRLEGRLVGVAEEAMYTFRIGFSFR